MEPSPNPGQLPKMGPRKQSNYINDLLGWAELSGVKISPDARTLLKSDARPALRAAMVAAELGRFREFHYPAYEARWCDAQDLSQRDALAGLFERAGIDPEPALARAESDELDKRLDAQTKDAIERGVFGVPTLFVGDRMFWGNDRFELIRYFLGQAQ